MAKRSHANYTLRKREEKTAYLMVFPALLVVFVVAIYPLGSAILTSFTNATFAGDHPPSFVGLSNYTNLLSIRVRVLKPVGNDAEGELLYESPSATFPRVETFRLTASSFNELRKVGLPLTALERLKTLRRRSIQGRSEFQSAVEDRLGSQAKQYLAKVVDNAQRTTYRYSSIGQLSLFGARIVIGARDGDFLIAVGNTLLFTIVTVAMETVLGLLLALLINRKFSGRGAMRALMLLPWAVPTAVSSRMWEWMFGATRTGFFNVVFQKLGLGNGQIPFLQLPSWQLPAMCVIDIWKTTPFMALLILAGLQQIPAELYEACEVDGVGRVRQLFAITLPLLRQAIAVALVFRTLDALRVFDLFQIVLGESKYSMASFTYYELIQSRAAGYSSASGVLIFIVVFAFAILYTRLLRVNAESDLG